MSGHTRVCLCVCEHVYSRHLCVYSRHLCVRACVRVRVLCVNTCNEGTCGTCVDMCVSVHAHLQLPFKASVMHVCTCV
jgi:hypothetical protein